MHNAWGRKSSHASATHEKHNPRKTIVRLKQLLLSIAYMAIPKL